MKHKRVKQLLRFILATGILGLIMVATLPWYFGWCLQAIGSRFDFHFGNYERIGYTRFALNEVKYTSTDSSLTVTCQRVRLPQPLALLLNNNRDISIDNWHVTLASVSEESPDQPQANVEESLPKILNEAIDRYQQFRPWLKTLKMSNGRATHHGAEIYIHQLQIEDETLSASGGIAATQDRFELLLDLADIRQPRLTVQVPNRAFNGLLQCIIAADTFELNVNLNYNKQDVVGQALWQSQGLLPQHASLQCDIDLAQINELNMSGQLTAKATPKWTDDSSAPKVLLTLHGQNIAYHDYQTQDINLSGSLQWPLLNVDALNIQLAPDTALSIQGQYNIKTKHVQDIELQSTITSQWINSIYPKDLEWDKATLDMLLNGRLDKLNHSGSCHFDGLILNDYPEFTGTNLSLDWQGLDTMIEDFQLTLIKLAEFELTAEGNLAYHADQALQFNIAADSSYQLSATHQISGHVELSANDTQVKHTLSITHGNHTLIDSHGQFPCSLHPGSTPFLQMQPAETEFDFHVICTPDQPMLARLVGNSGWNISEPSLEAKIMGSLNDVRGNLSLHAAQISAPPVSAAAIPPFKNIRLLASIDQHQCTITTLETFVEGHGLSGQATLPLEPKDWQRLVEQFEFPSIDKLTGTLQCESIPIDTFSPWLPKALRPEGFIQGEVSLNPGKQWQGKLQLSDGATYPLSPFGSLRDINAAIQVQQNAVTIDNLAATIGEQPIRIYGNIDMQNLDDLGYDLRLEADAIPIMRSGGVVLKGSPDLQLKTTDHETKITGTVVLQDSFLTINLADLQVNLSGGQSHQGAPPIFPYFSIQQEPIRSWKMDINIQGDHFLRIGTPGFTGTASIDYHLGGMLAEPVAIGEVTLEQGSIQFPFATFATGQTQIKTTAQSPFEPQLFLSAKSKKFGYDLMMQGSGSAINPEITFSSIPQLDSSEVLLLITTGQIPQSDYAKTSAQRISGIGMYFGKGLLTELGWLEPKENRLAVRVGEEITETGRDTVEVEYEFTNSLSGVGHYDRFDTYNLDLHWKVFER